MAKDLSLKEHRKDYNCIKTHDSESRGQEEAGRKRDEQVLFYSIYWQGRYEGLYENQQSVNDCVSTISDMGKMAMKVSFSKSNSYIC